MNSAPHLGDDDPCSLSFQSPPRSPSLPCSPLRAATAVHSQSLQQETNAIHELTSQPQLHMSIQPQLHMTSQPQLHSPLQPHNQPPAHGHSHSQLKPHIPTPPRIQPHSPPEAAPEHAVQENLSEAAAQHSSESHLVAALRRDLEMSKQSHRASLKSAHEAQQTEQAVIVELQMLRVENAGLRQLRHSHTEQLMRHTELQSHHKALQHTLGCEREAAAAHQQMQQAQMEAPNIECDRLRRVIEGLKLRRADANYSQPRSPSPQASHAAESSSTHAAEESTARGALLIVRAQLQQTEGQLREAQAQLMEAHAQAKVQQLEVRAQLQRVNTKDSQISLAADRASRVAAEAAVAARSRIELLESSVQQERLKCCKSDTYLAAVGKRLREVGEELADLKLHSNRQQHLPGEDSQIVQQHEAAVSTLQVEYEVAAAQQTAASRSSHQEAVSLVARQLQVGQQLEVQLRTRILQLESQATEQEAQLQCAAERTDEQRAQNTAIAALKQQLQTSEQLVNEVRLKLDLQLTTHEQQLATQYTTHNQRLEAQQKSHEESLKVLSIDCENAKQQYDDAVSGWQQDRREHLQEATTLREDLQRLREELHQAQASHDDVVSAWQQERAAAADAMAAVKRERQKDAQQLMQCQEALRESGNESCVLEAHGDAQVEGLQKQLEKALFKCSELHSQRESTRAAHCRDRERMIQIDDRLGCANEELRTAHAELQRAHTAHANELERAYAEAQRVKALTDTRASQLSVDNKHAVTELQRQHKHATDLASTEFKHTTHQAERQHKHATSELQLHHKHEIGELQLKLAETMGHMEVLEEAAAAAEQKLRVARSNADELEAKLSALRLKSLKGLRGATVEQQQSRAQRVTELEGMVQDARQRMHQMEQQHEQGSLSKEKAILSTKSFSEAMLKQLSEHKEDRVILEQQLSDKEQQLQQLRLQLLEANNNNSHQQQQPSRNVSVKCEVEVGVNAPKMPSVECEVEVEVNGPKTTSVECEVEVEVNAPKTPSVDLDSPSHKLGKNAGETWRKSMTQTSVDVYPLRDKGFIDEVLPIAMSPTSPARHLKQNELKRQHQAQRAELAAQREAQV